MASERKLRYVPIDDVPRAKAPPFLGLHIRVLSNVPVVVRSVDPDDVVTNGFFLATEKKPDTSLQFPAHELLDALRVKLTKVAQKYRSVLHPNIVEAVLPTLRTKPCFAFATPVEFVLDAEKPRRLGPDSFCTEALCLFAQDRTTVDRTAYTELATWSLGISVVDDDHDASMDPR